jgi:hypothetical protein
MAYVGRVVPVVGVQASQPSKRVDQGDELVSFAEADAKATLLGNYFRSLGIAIGLLGITMVLLSIAPIGLGLDATMSQIFSYLRVVMMLLVLLIVIKGQRSDLKHDWIRFRRIAELHRYQGLANAIDLYKADPASQEKRDSLLEMLSHILDGEYGQVAYNASKADKFDLILRLSGFLVWLSFTLGFIGLVGNIFSPWGFWIFLTAFAPAAIGGIHGINGFLGVGGMAEQHRTMELQLMCFQSALNEMKAKFNYDSAHLLDLATGALDTLNSRDALWEGIARKLGIQPA